MVNIRELLDKNQIAFLKNFQTLLIGEVTRVKLLEKIKSQESYESLDEEAKGIYDAIFKDLFKEKLCFQEILYLLNSNLGGKQREELRAIGDYLPSINFFDGEYRRGNLTSAKKRNVYSRSLISFINAYSRYFREKGIIN